MTRAKTATPPTSPASPGLQVSYVNLRELQRWPVNPKQHDVGAIGVSIQEFGFRDPLAVNVRTRELEEGHGRLDALQAMKAAGQPAPAYIESKAGEWFVPVLWFDDEPDTQHRYALAHNRTQDLGGGYQDTLLTQILADLAARDALLGTGYDVDDVDRLLRHVAFEARLAGEVDLGEKTTCPACATMFPKYGWDHERLTCPNPSCRAKVSTGLHGDPQGTIALTFNVPEAQRPKILNVLRAIQAEQAGVSTGGAALFWLVTWYDEHPPA